jgi:hypothetical protein
MKLDDVTALVVAASRSRRSSHLRRHPPPQSQQTVYRMVSLAVSHLSLCSQFQLRLSPPSPAVPMLSLHALHPGFVMLLMMKTGFVPA